MCDCNTLPLNAASRRKMQGYRKIQGEAAPTVVAPIPELLKQPRIVRQYADTAERQKIKPVCRAGKHDASAVKRTEIWE